MSHFSYDSVLREMYKYLGETPCTVVRFCQINLLLNIHLKLQDKLVLPHQQQQQTFYNLTSLPPSSRAEIQAKKVCFYIIYYIFLLTKYPACF